MLTDIVRSFLGSVIASPRWSSVMNLVWGLAALSLGLYCVLRFIFGLSVGWINPFLGKVHNIGLKTKAISISIGYVQLKLSFFDLSNVVLVVDGVDVVLHRTPADSANARKQPKKLKVPSMEDLLALDPDKPTCIFSNHTKLRYAVKFYLFYFRFIGVKIVNTNIKTDDEVWVIHAEMFHAKIDMTRGKKDNGTITARFVQLSVNALEVADSCVLQTTGSLDTSTGLLHGLKVNLDTRVFSLRVLSFIRRLKSSGHCQPPSTTPPITDDLDEESKYIIHMYQKLKRYCVWVRLIDSINISFQSINIEELPLVSTEIMGCAKYNPIVLLHLSVKSFVFSTRRMYSDSPGFGLLYSHDDKPYRMVYNFTGISVEMEHANAGSRKEIISIPAMNLTGTSNVAFRTLEATIAKEVSKGQVILSGHLSDPIIDMSTQDISLAVQSALDFLRYLHLLNSDSSEPQAQDTSNSSTQQWLLQKRISEMWPAVEVRLGIENPVIMTKSQFEDNYLKILMLELSLLSLEVKATREIQDGVSKYVSRQKLELHNTRVAYRDTKSGLELNMVKVRDISIHQLFTILPVRGLVSSVNTESTMLDLSDLYALNGVNHIISELDSMIVPQIRHFKRNFAMKCQEVQSDTASSALPDERTPLAIIHDLIPAWFQGAEFSSVDATLVTGSRSVLLNKELVKVIEPQAPNDLVNGELRKVELQMQKSNFKISTGVEKGPESDQSSTSAMEDDDQGLFDSSSESSGGNDKWSLKITTDRVIGRIISEKSHNKHALNSKIFLKVPGQSITLKPCPQGNEALYLTWNLSRIEMFYSIITHFTILSAFHLVRNTVFEFMHKNPIGGSQGSSKSNGNAKKILDVLHISLNWDVLDIILILPDRMRLRLEVTEFQSSLKLDVPLVFSAAFTRLCTDSPKAPGYWTRIITAVNGSTSVDIPAMLSKTEGTWIETMNDTCHIKFPHQLVIYKIFDNISVTVKTLKQLHHSLKYNSDEFVITPKEMRPIKIPKANLKSGRVLCSMEDDPFEAELNMIFQIGLAEQKMRIEKIKAFELRIEEALRAKQHAPQSQHPHSKRRMPLEVEDVLNSIKYLPRKLGKLGHGHIHGHANGHGQDNTSSFPSEARDATPIVPESLKTGKIHDSALEQLQALYKGFGKSWVARVKAYQAKADQSFESGFEYLWGTIDTRTTKNFDSRVLEFIKSAPLFNLILDGVDLDIGQPGFGLEHIPDFLYDVGKGVPKDTAFSTLIPLHLDLKLDELRLHLRDYPIPMIYMPAVTKKQDKSLSAVRVRGDLVIGEFMIKSHEEVREFYVPLVPGCGEFDEDNCYSIEVPKTLTSIKFYTSLDWELNSAEETQVCWSSSYQPCIQQIMLNLDDFTKPPIDPSEKVGFWDKMRANFHARFLFKFMKAGGLHILLKGSKDPYAIGGVSSGFVLCFKENVMLAVNKDDDPKDFILAEAEEISFNAPNLFAKPLLIWSQPTQSAVLLSDTASNYHKSAFGYYLSDVSEIDSSQSSTLQRNYIDKCVIRLSGGVSLNLGFNFERKIDGSLDRTSEFIPHYDIVLRNPKYVKDVSAYDAYRGFRSQFIHMALTLISSNTEAYNTIQLSPVAFMHFFSWWKMFSNSFPVRHGRLFGPEKPTQKFSRHLYTIKYQALVEPLFVSHMYQDLDYKEDHEDHEDVDCVGIKGRASKFTLDLHQRKELTFDHNEKLGITRKSMKMKFNIGNLDLEHFDVRAMEALFVKSHHYGDAGELKSPDHSFSAFDDDESWFDLSDFCEIGEADRSALDATVAVFPLMYTPRFQYFKTNGYGDKFQVDDQTGEHVLPFGRESFHKCLTECNPSSETQESLFEMRAAELHATLEANLDKIAMLDQEKASPAEIRFMGQLRADNDQLQAGIKLLDLVRKQDKDPDIADDLSRFAPDEDSEDSFLNRFIVHNMMLKWNHESRDILYRYVYILEMRGAVSNFANHKALSQLDEAIDGRHVLEHEDTYSMTRATTVESMPMDDPPTHLSETMAAAHIKRFKKDLRELATGIPYKTHDNYLVKLISPQIQLQTSLEESSVVLVAAPTIELELISFDTNEAENAADECIFQRRLCAVLTDASIFLFHEEEFTSTGKMLFNSSSYGTLESWPPWLGVELCYDGSLISDYVLMEKTTVIIQYDKPTSYFAGPKEEDVTRLSLDLSQAMVTCDAEQYNSLYTIVMNLLIYNDPRNLKLKQQEQKMLLSVDLEDLVSLRARISDLQSAITALQDIIGNLASRRSILDDVGLSDLNLLKTARMEAYLELFLLMKVSSAGTRKSTEDAADFLEWNFRADDIKLHMLDEKRHPFLDVILFNFHFKRMERSDRSDRNTISIQNLEIINLDKESSLPVLFSEHEVKSKSHHASGAKIQREGETEPLILLNWHMDYPVGGIRLMRRFDISVKPIQLSIEELTGHKIMKYVFPEHEESDDILSDDSTSVRSVDSRSAITKAQKPPTSPLANQFDAHSRIVKHRDSNPFKASTPRSSITNSRDSDHIDGAMSSPKHAGGHEENGLDDMVDRASKYISFAHFRLRSTALCITFRGKGSKKLINVSNFVFQMPDIAINNRTLTLHDLSLYIRKMVIKSLLSHTGSILGNKLTKHRAPQNRIQNISAYASERIETFRND